jgi:hypothetical protein
MTKVRDKIDSIFEGKRWDLNSFYKYIAKGMKNKTLAQEEVESILESTKEEINIFTKCSNKIADTLKDHRYLELKNC